MPKAINDTNTSKKVKNASGPVISIDWPIFLQLQKISAFVAINDVTGFGIFDDVLLAPLSAGFAEGLIKIYGQ